MTQRTPQPDGTVTVTKSSTNYTFYDLSIAGSFELYSLPLPVDPSLGYDYAYGSKGDEKSFMPLVK